MRVPITLVAFVAGMVVLTGCASAPRAGGGIETGVASYYAYKYHGRATASGERFDMNEFTAAHQTLPFGARVRVTNLDNGKSVTVRINDRGPFVKGRVIDLSLAAAKRIDMINAGLANVEVRQVGADHTALSRADNYRAARPTASHCRDEAVHCTTARSAGCSCWAGPKNS